HVAAFPGCLALRLPVHLPAVAMRALLRFIVLEANLLLSLSDRQFARSHRAGCAWLRSPARSVFQTGLRDRHSAVARCCLADLRAGGGLERRLPLPAFPESLRRCGPLQRPG